MLSNACSVGYSPYSPKLGKDKRHEIRQISPGVSKKIALFQVISTFWLVLGMLMAVYSIMQSGSRAIGQFGCMPSTQSKRGFCI